MADQRRRRMLLTADADVDQRHDFIFGRETVRVGPLISRAPDKNRINDFFITVFC